MCGIIGYIGEKQFLEISKKALLNLEYRGYDSAGIAFFQNNEICAYKKAGNVENLYNSLDFEVNSSCGIGHTRWATHGAPSDKNSHPHKSYDGEFWVVHNGIIENYKELKTKYFNDVTFESTTDTEIIPNLLSMFYKEKNDIKQAIVSTMEILSGSYAVAILHKSEPDKIYFAKNKSPLLIGIGKNENFISSDIVGFNDETNNFIKIDDMEFGYITKSDFFVFNEKTQKNIKKIQKNQEKTFKNSKNGHRHYMLKEINDIPLAIAETVKLYKKTKNPLTKIPKEYFKNIDEINFIACGTSFHAGLIGQKYIKNFTTSKSNSFIASEFIYNEEKINEKSLCIFISQSGETADTLTAIKKAKSFGAKTIGITNVSTSSINYLCDYILPIKAGSEIAVASTKAYNAQLTILLIFSRFLANNCKNSQKNLKIIESFSKKLEIEEIESKIKNISLKLKDAKNIYMIGRDFDYITCKEASLKIKEISYIPCSAFPAGELKHGTLALISKNTPVIAIITEKDLIDKTMNIVNQVIARGGKVYLFSQFNLDNYNSSNCEFIKLENFEPCLMPLYTIIYFQLLAYNITTLLGHDPDRPRNLAKSVTVE